MSNDYISIKSWSKEDRPREKLQFQGRDVLSNSELIAILLGSGSKNESAVSLAQRILKSVDNDLNALGKLEIEDLTNFKGIGPAKAITLIAALELGRRRKAVIKESKPVITCSNDAYAYIRSKFEDLNHEEMHVIYMNHGGQVIRDEALFSGGVSSTVADPKIIFKKALQYLASSIIIVHNHPSGNLKPSQQDISLTEKIKEGGKLLEISIRDHLIVTDIGYYSFLDEGLI